MMRICGMDIELVESSPSAWAKNAMGRSDSVYGTIHLREDMPLSVKQATLIHEVLHMICDANGLSVVADNECAISVISNSIYAFIRENPEVIKKMILEE